MRVLSLVPSLTETLAECGVTLVGRTRFCIHPMNQMQRLPAVGGTKDLNWEKLKDLQPELLVLDREENLPWMKEQSPCAVHVFHATSLESMPSELEKLAQRFEVDEPDAFKNLMALAKRYQMICGQADLPWNFMSVPGGLQKTKRSADFNPDDMERITYVIWKKPWMRVTNETYIGSVMKKLGAGDWLEVDPVDDVEVAKKYPEFVLDDDNHKTTFYLFSSEPYPFARETTNLEERNLNFALVDGESYSWFGIRSLRFLEAQFVGYSGVTVE